VVFATNGSQSMVAVKASGGIELWNSSSSLSTWRSLDVEFPVAIKVSGEVCDSEFDDRSAIGSV